MTYYGYEIEHDAEDDTWEVLMGGWVITCKSSAEAKHEVRSWLGLESEAFEQGA